MSVILEWESLSVFINLKQINLILFEVSGTRKYELLIMSVTNECKYCLAFIHLKKSLTFLWNEWKWKFKLFIMNAAIEWK